MEARTHLSNWEAGVTMSLYSAEPYMGEDLSRDAYPLEILVNLEQGYREAAPTISLEPEGGLKEERPSSLNMTVDEAERIARALLKAVKLARG
ncbi:hypothetical protein B0293_07755 [Amycolatopsis azurea DSM 43854]|uniref:Uncharacterized protein n=1 Tax=Amycolatopsis azurea DSM 43854 TaxID=1238180 RepID=M2QUG3_9PSEU|nr:hypothetical protein C791_2986 [Amycolatopsis azurea DSM 43854]OOC07554.1 hypothetical protein B0293_07755 [Amycolatopsis azurea DSM 43854]